MHACVYMCMYIYIYIYIYIYHVYIYIYVLILRFGCPLISLRPTLLVDEEHRPPGKLPPSEPDLPSRRRLDGPLPVVACAPMTSKLRRKAQIRT